MTQEDTGNRLRNAAKAAASILSILKYEAERCPECQGRLSVSELEIARHIIAELKATVKDWEEAKESK